MPRTYSVDCVEEDEMRGERSSETAEARASSGQGA